MKIRIQWSDKLDDQRVFDLDVCPRIGDEVVWREGMLVGGDAEPTEFTTRVMYVFHLVDAPIVKVKLWCQSPSRRLL